MCMALALLVASAGVSLAQPAPSAPYVPPPPTPQSEVPQSLPSSSQPEVYRPRPAQLAEPEPEPMPQPVPTRGPGRIWADADYLIWWFKNAGLATPLLTTGPQSALLPGFLGDPNTIVLFGDKDLDHGTFAGMRFTSGLWFNPAQTIGIEGRGFMTERRSIGYSTRADSGGNPFLLRPFFDPTQTSEAVATIAVPGLLTGGFSASSASRLWGVESNLLFSLVQEWRTRADLLVGFLYLDLRESLDINEDYGPLAIPGGNPIPFNGGVVDFPHVLQVHDRFRTHDQFYGGQVGGRVNVAFNRFDLNLLGKLAMGTTHQVVDVFGITTDQIGSGPVLAQANGGLLAVPTNSGRFTQNLFTVVPSAEIKLGWWLTRFMRLQAGYSFLFWSNVVRPGEQIDRRINPNQVPSFTTFTPGIPNPAVPTLSAGRTESFWVQGIDVGVEFRY